MEEKPLIEIPGNVNDSVDLTDIKRGFNKTFNFLKQKKTRNIILVILFILLLIGGSWIRLQNLSLLEESTTGEFIPLALDPFYFLRIAETIVDSGELPSFDSMRYPSAQVDFSKEILPQAIVLLYKIWKVFDSSVSLQFVDVVSPVIFFILGLITFYFLIFALTKSKSKSFLSSLFLAIIPTYLYRTMGGFADHESFGMFIFFVALLTYSFALKFLEKRAHLETKNTRNYKSLLWGVVIGFLSTLTLVAWGGISNFVFMIIPLSFGLFWLISFKNPQETNKSPLTFLLFFLAWFVSSVLFSGVFGYDIIYILKSYVFGAQKLIVLFVMGFILIDSYIIHSMKKGGFFRNKNKKRIFYSFGITAILGLIILAIFGGGPINSISSVFERFLHPFGTSRTGLTVAENKQPFLQDWINSIGKIFFWLFYLGMVFVGLGISKGIGKKKNKIIFSILWLAMVSGLLFSRISSGSLFNGTNFISQAVYFGSLLIFGLFSLWVYLNDNIKISSRIILLSSWLFFMLIAGRGAIRFFFLITPFACFAAGSFIIDIFDYAKKSKDEFLKMIYWVVFALTIIGVLISLNSFVISSANQAKHTGPSASTQWQGAMEWVRENTVPGGIFVHWWDYGYWVQYLGERPTVTDGGHAVGFWDHLIGRYVLTTPYPEAAFSFMKSHDVSYLLIDPTDIGKYPAYSKIGSGLDGEDRYSWIPTMSSDPSQVSETKDGIIRVYQGGTPLDSDIIYDLDGNQIFLPAGKAALIGVTVETTETQIRQANAVFLYNQKQTTIPLRYIYYDGVLLDFETGLEAAIYIYPRVTQSGDGGLQIDALGMLMYFSQKTVNSLFVQNYIFNNPSGAYNGLELVHTESDPVVKSLNSQGANLPEFIQFSGFRGPIKIWKVNYPSNIVSNEEFLKRSGEYAELDDLVFKK